MKALIFLFIMMGFLGVVAANEVYFNSNEGYCESYETYEECEEDYYTGPDGQQFDENGNSVDDSNDSGGAHYMDPDDGSGWYNGI